MNRIRGAALGIWLGWVVYIVLFPNWQEAAEREKDYRKDLGVHFVLNPPAPVAVPCYFVGCITAPASYFHVLIDRSGFYPNLICVTVLMVIALGVFRVRRDGSTRRITSLHTRVIAIPLIALALPLPLTPYSPLGTMAAYLPTAILHPDHDHIGVLIGFPIFFAIYSGAAYLIIRTAIWANTSPKPGS